tara:strand:- start:3368 stop:3514 length:147 start_codon:yes stop_codon:yes gene_type:complete
MEKQEVLNKLEEIKALVDTDFLNRNTIEGIVNDIESLIFNINVNTEDF